MNEYLEQAKNFLNKANAKCEIVYGGISRNENWKEKEKRNWYDVTITTPRGKMTFTFWDSIHNTEISTMTFCILFFPLSIGYDICRFIRWAFTVGRKDY